MTGSRPRSGVACGVVLGAIALALPLVWLTQQIKWPTAESGEIARDAVDVRSVTTGAAPTDGAAPESEPASPAVLDIAADAPAVAEAGAKALDPGHDRPSRPVARNGVAVIAPAPPEHQAAPAPGASDSGAMPERLAHVPAEAPATAPRAAAAEAPVIAVRAGRHAGFERIVFDWAEPVGYDIERNAGSLVISFDRPGRIDLSPAVGRLGPRVLSAWTEGGAVTRRTILRVRPDTTFRAFSVYGTRVVIDVLDATGGLSSAARSGAPAAPPSARIQSELLERDLLIADLLARVEQLERERILTPAELDRAIGAGLGVSPSGARPSLAPPEAAVRTVSQAKPPPARPAAAPEPASSGRPSGEPGRVEVEPEAAERALERTLVRTGALLLPYGLAEIEPTFSYARREADAPTFVSNNGDTFVGTTRVRRNEFLIGQDLRVGLPFDSQLELGAGYRYVDQSTVTMVGFAAQEDDRDSGHGSADFSVGLAKTLLREGAGWWPDLVGRLTWDTNTGRTRNGGVALGGGFNELRVSLSATKRQDPLAFIGSLSYETTFEEDDVKPGDAIGVAIGAVLAASPATSLRTVLSQSFVDETRVDGQTSGGTDRAVGVLTLGASSILGRGISLDIATDIGLSDGLDYAVRASLPVRFNMPVP